MIQSRFIKEITQKLPNNVGVSLINKKAPILTQRLSIGMIVLYCLPNLLEVQAVLRKISYQKHHALAQFFHLSF